MFKEKIIHRRPRRSYFFRVKTPLEVNVSYIIYEALSYLGETDNAWRLMVRLAGYIDLSGKFVYVDCKDNNGDDVVETHSIAKQLYVSTEKIPHPDNPRRMIERDIYEPSKRPSFIDKIPHWRKSELPTTWHDLKKEFPAAFGLEDIPDSNTEFEQKRKESLMKSKIIEKWEEDKDKPP